MAYQKHALVAICGKWSASDLADEQWQIGVRVSTHEAAGWWLEGPQAYADVVGPLIATWFGTPANLMRNDAYLTTVKVNNITPTGHYADPVTHQHAFSGTGNTGGSAPTTPAFCCIAATLETGNTTGRARRGRIYLPSAAGRSAGVSISNADAASVVTATKALLTILLRNEPTGGALVQPEIVSKIDGSLNDINGVSCNTIWDVQRRRKNRATGTRTAVSAWP